MEKPEYKEPSLSIDAAVVERHDHRAGADDYSQAGALFRLMSSEQQRQLANNIAGSLGQASWEVQERMLVHFDECDRQYGRMIRDAIAATNQMAMAS